MLLLSFADGRGSEQAMPNVGLYLTPWSSSAVNAEQSEMFPISAGGGIEFSGTLATAPFAPLQPKSRLNLQERQHEVRLHAVLRG